MFAEAMLAALAFSGDCYYDDSWRRAAAMVTSPPLRPLDDTADCLLNCLAKYFTHSLCSLCYCSPPPPIGEQSTSFGWGKDGSVTSAGWQVTLCDHVWHVSSRCGVATLRTAIHLCVFVGDYINGTACPRSPPNFCACCLWPRSDLSLAALRYVMYFRFTDGVIQLAIP